MARGRSFEIAPFAPRHLADASALVAARVATLRRGLPLLPERWSRPDAFSERLAELVEHHPAAVALVDGAVAGFMAARRFEWSQGRWAYSPEWANFAGGPSARAMRHELYAALAGLWMADDRRAHFVGLLPDDEDGREALAWLGFGTTNVDGLRDLAPLAGTAGVALDVVRAGLDDIDALATLEQGLRDHLAATPLFLRYPALDRAELLAGLADQRTATLLATDERGPLAYLRIGPHSTDASTLIRDPATASITGAFTRADRRGEGVARTLLDAALAWARDSGYVRCAVDFESANLLASSFWPQHFTIVGLTVGRRL